jgi:putative endonuclease
MSRAPDAKHAALKRGASGEWLAAMALRLKGWRIVERNFRCPLGEIDVIARKGDLIAFVEVKARASEAEALYAVTGEARRRIANAAACWIGRQRDAARLSWRFDIIAIVPRRWPRHHADAF